jgi:hypothetical protein
MRSDKILRGLAVSSVALLGACSAAAVEWGEPVPAGAELSGAGVLSFQRGAPTASDRPAVAPPAMPGQCAGSARVARDTTTGDWYAAWWGARPDSTAELLASRSSDGDEWGPPVAVDTTDAGRVGCNRPAPSVTADRGNFFVVYAMTAREGPGIFASHSMDRGTMFHAPVAVVYGERIGRAAIAAEGDIVVVAYEDPNTEPRRIALALSRTMGHLFQSRMAVSPPAVQARDPAVAVAGGRIAVTWRPVNAGGDAGRLLRVGAIR